MDNASIDAPIYEQREDEPGAHFAWFQTFLLLGAGRRSVNGAYKKFHAGSQKLGTTLKVLKVSKNWYDAAEKWNWKGRAGAWDREQWAKHRRRVEEDAVELQSALKKSVLEKLHLSATIDSLPLMEQTGTGPNGEFILTPAKWDRGTSARLAMAAAATSREWREMWMFRVGVQNDAEPDEETLAQLVEVLRQNGATVSAPWEEPDDESEEDEDDE